MIETRPTHKQCPACQNTLPFDAAHFHADSTKKWGLASSCRDCAKKRALAFYQKNPEHVKTKVHERQQARRAHGLPILIDPAKEERRKEKTKKRCREWYHRDLSASRARERARIRTEEDRARIRQWKRDNPGRVRSHNAKRKGLLQASDGHYTQEDIIGLREQQKGLCAYCQCQMAVTGRLRETIDHIIPISKGGSNDLTNIVLACRECNLSKSDQDLDVFLARTDRPGLG